MAAGSYCIDETLSRFLGRNPILVKMPRKPAGQGILYHTLAMRSIPYVEKLLSGKDCSEKGLKNYEVCEKLLGEKLDGRGLPLIADRGYSTLDLVRMSTIRKIPFLGTIKNSFLGGDYPIFPKAASKNFERKSYTFRVRGENIFMTAFYDYGAKKPVVFISNFHCGELSMSYTTSHRDRPMVAEIYSIQMCGVDLWDKTSFFYDISRKTNKWTTRVFENIINYSLCNARIAYCLANDECPQKYTVKTLYLEILHQSYRHAWPVSSINYTFKPPNEKPLRCNWHGCSYKSRSPCSNTDCEKQACISHSVELCIKCLKNQDIKKLTILKNVPAISTTRCKQLDNSATQHNCTKRTNVQCATLGCGQPLCKLHKFKLCFDCALHLDTSGNCAIHLLPKHIPLGH